ncbi:COX assembly mitochondrial protein homolog isoform X2 [Portunus trituberculatus]|uniref:COX assembly mitochondrial protein homolog isoform X2 n=1 Tax=Portunus trituberculatus TaxID=210409 RepID=UPI001E1D19DF|nr:COX assembly mitochondrial protein homolog isoform X2 [Portunus trituberculatus]
MAEEEEAKIFRNAGGPHGLGDPEDRSLRKVEREVCIPKKMRDIARQEKCTAEVEDFTQCCKASGLAMVMLCSQQNSTLKACLTKWYQDEEFKKRCTEEFLAERREFRRTGLTKKARLALEEEAKG